MFDADFYICKDSMLLAAP